MFHYYVTLVNVSSFFTRLRSNWTFYWNICLCLSSFCLNRPLRQITWNFHLYIFPDEKKKRFFPEFNFALISNANLLRVYEKKETNLREKNHSHLFRLHFYWVDLWENTRGCWFLLYLCYRHRFVSIACIRV